MRREAAIFLVIGALTVLIDFVAYRLITVTELVGIDAGKAMGFVTGTAFAYAANRMITFGHVDHRPRSLPRFVALYGTTLLLNVGANASALAMLGEDTSSVRVAFLAATMLSATVNFLGMKFFVFRSVATVAPEAAEP